MSKIIIAIDGPAASGKGTLARKIAKHFGLQYLDTGSLYRAVALKVLECESDAIKVAKNLTIEDTKSPKLRGEEVGNLASQVSAIPEVRQALLDFQREFSLQGAVLDGRDIGTVVCPNADIKFYITASVDIRAERRAKELGGDIEIIKKDLAERDKRDMERAVAPLKPADDAVIIDTSNMNIDIVFDRAVGIIKDII